MVNLELGVVESENADSNYPNPSLEKKLIEKIKKKVLQHTGKLVYPVIGAGSDQLIDTLARVTSSEEILHIVPVPAYFSHLEYLRKNKAHVVEFPYVLQDAGEDIAKKLGFIQRGAEHTYIWVTTPQNPTGVEIDVKPLIGKNVSVIVDEAYGEFSDIKPFSSSAVKFADEAEIIVLRSFSKGLGKAGIRLGYMLTIDDAFADAVRAHLPLFPTSRKTLEEGISAIDNYEHITEAVRKKAASCRDYFLGVLRELQQSTGDVDLQYQNPAAITCMIWATRDGAPIELYVPLLQRDVHVQNLQNIAGVPDSAIRVTMAESYKTDEFMRQLREVLHATN